MAKTSLPSLNKMTSSVKSESASINTPNAESSWGACRGAVGLRVLEPKDLSQNGYEFVFINSMEEEPQ